MRPLVEPYESLFNLLFKSQCPNHFSIAFIKHSYIIIQFIVNMYDVAFAMINILERQFRMVVHSFIRDFKDSSKVAYIEIFMKNSNYDIVETIKNGDCLLDALLYFFIT